LEQLDEERFGNIFIITGVPSCPGLSQDIKSKLRAEGHQINLFYAQIVQSLILLLRTPINDGYSCGDTLDSMPPLFFSSSSSSSSSATRRWLPNA